LIAGYVAIIESCFQPEVAGGRVRCRVVANPSERGARPARRVGAARPRLNQSVRITPDLRARLRMWAAYQDKEISTVVEEALAAHLDALDRTRAERGLDPMPQPDEEADSRPATGRAPEEEPRGRRDADRVPPDTAPCVVSRDDHDRRHP
jgi:hypothetical protein